MAGTAAAVVEAGSPEELEEEMPTFMAACPPGAPVRDRIPEI